MAYLMGIDLGTSSVKVLIVDEEGNAKSIESTDYPILIPKQNYAEQDPEAWWKAAVSVIRKSLAVSGVCAVDIKAVGFSGQMHGLVAVDKNNKVIRPAILWCDQRSKEQVDDLHKKFTKPELGQMIGNTVATGFLLSSLLWMKENEPEYYKNIHKVMLCKDYLRYRLTGVIMSDYTDAAGTSAFDIVSLSWSKNMITSLGLESDMFPSLGQPWHTGGTVTKRAAEETGLAEGTLVVLGGGDQPMQLAGNGIIRKGTFASNIGTGGQLTACIDKPLYDPELRTQTYCHAAEDTWYIMGAILNAGQSLRWLRDSILPNSNFNELSLRAASLPAGSEGLLFLPYLTGERTPHMDPDATGMFFGLTLKHTAIHMVRAVMEGVVFALKDSMKIFEAMDIQAEKIIASGGGAKSSLWLQMQADIYQKEIYTTQIEEQACLGAAIMAGVGAGIYTDVKSACKNLIQLNRVYISPNLKNIEIYRDNYEIYKELYPRNRELFKKATGRK